MERQILHVDVNNAFLSWTAIEMLKDGYEVDIRTIPCIIGGDEARRSGIVLAKSTKAKQYGISTAETIYEAKRKCPCLQVFSGLEYRKYKEYSNKLYNLLLEYTDKIERYSIDECFLDMTEYLMNDTLLNKAIEINKRVKEELGFTVNIGVAHNKLLAKMASDFQKPDKVHTLFENEIETKMWKLPVSELFMLGKKTTQVLNHMRIRTIGELAKTEENLLIRKFGKQGKLIWEYSNGIDNSKVEYEERLPKSIGNSVTFPRDIFKVEELEKVLFSLTEQVTFRLRRYDLLAKSVGVQIRTNDFKDYSHQGKLEIDTASTNFIYKEAKKLLNELYQRGTAIRLLGVKVDNLIAKDEMQISLFSEEKSEKQEKIDEIVDKIKEKYGYDFITRASNMKVDEIVKINRK